MSRYILMGFGVCLLLLLLFAGAMCFGWLPGHQVDPSKLELLEAGMTCDEVIAPLGVPTSIEHSPSGQITLIYSSKLFVSCCCVQVHLDSENWREPSVFHDCFQ